MSKTPREQLLEGAITAETIAAGAIKKVMPAREAAARALCKRDGHPENIKFEGRLMWESYLDVVDVVLAAIGYQALMQGRSDGIKKP